MDVEPGSRAGSLSLLGGRLALDFANTLDPRTEPPRPEHENLRVYADLLTWDRHAGALDDEAAGRLGRAAENRPAEAEAALEKAKALRELVYRVFSSAAAGLRPTGPDLEGLSATLVGLLGRSRLVPGPSGFAWAWGGPQEALEHPLWPVARSAAALLTGPELGRVRECPGSPGRPCHWLFLDESKNHSRHWCSMEGCGNRAKARRHLERRRGLGDSGPD